MANPQDCFDDDPLPFDDANLPGVHNDETEDDVEIPGVDPPWQEMQAPTTPAETEQEVDLDFTPTEEGNVEPPMVNTPNIPIGNPGPADDGVRRSTRVRAQAKQAYIPTMSGKKYSFATTVLGGRMLDD